MTPIPVVGLLGWSLDTEIGEGVMTVIVFLNFLLHAALSKIRSVVQGHLSLLGEVQAKNALDSIDLENETAVSELLANAKKEYQEFWSMVPQNDRIAGFYDITQRDIVDSIKAEYIIERLKSDQ